MTEQDWLTATDPTSMSEFVRNGGKASDRKLRLFAVACCGDIWSLLRDDRSRAAVKIAEEYADGLVTEAEMTEIRDAAMAISGEWPPWPEISIMNAIAATVASTAKRPFAAAKQTAKLVSTAQPNLVRLHADDIFGNPFRPVSIDPAWCRWQDGTIPKLAQAIYEERAFDRLPEIGDSLEEAGCADTNILAHCRGPGPHVRGCWVVDLFLGKE